MELHNVPSESAEEKESSNAARTKQWVLYTSPVPILEVKNLMFLERKKEFTHIYAMQPRYVSALTYMNSKEGSDYT